jgi:PAS domain-containing protein
VRESRLIVDSIPGLVVVLAPDGEVEFVNRQGLEFFGQPLEELKHWGTNGAIHPEDLPRLIEHFTQAIASGLPFEWELTWSTFRRRVPLVSVSRASAEGGERVAQR